MRAWHRVSLRTVKRAMAHLTSEAIAKTAATVPLLMCDQPPLPQVRYATVTMAEAQRASKTTALMASSPRPLISAAETKARCAIPVTPHSPTQPEKRYVLLCSLTVASASTTRPHRLSGPSFLANGHGTGRHHLDVNAGRRNQNCRSLRQMRQRPLEITHAHVGPLSKLTEAPFVGFVSAVAGTFFDFLLRTGQHLPMQRSSQTCATSQKWVSSDFSHSLFALHETCTRTRIAP